MAQKPVLRAEVYARALRASQNVKRPGVFIQAKPALQKHPERPRQRSRAARGSEGPFTVQRAVALSVMIERARVFLPVGLVLVTVRNR
jgi:hypothetical protein